MRVFEFPVINSASSQSSCVALWYIGKDGTVGLLSSPVFSKAHRAWRRVKVSPRGFYTKMVLSAKYCVAKTNFEGGRF